MAKSNAAVSFDLPAIVAPVVPVNVTVRAAMTMTALRLNFPEYFARPTIAQLLAKNATDSLIMATLTGYAMHKAHSGMGDNEPGLSDVRGLIVYTKDKKSVTAISQKWARAYDILKAVENKCIGAAGDIEAFKAFAADVEALFLPCFIKPVKVATAKTDSAATAATDSEDGAATDSAAPAANIVSAAVTIIATMTAEQLDAVEAAIKARRTMLTAAPF